MVQLSPVRPDHLPYLNIPLIALLRPPRSADRTRSPAAVSRKREYFKYPPETIGDFVLEGAKGGVWRPTIALAKHLDISFQQGQKYEKGINRVGAARLQQIAEVLGVDISFFYDGDGKEPAVESLLVLNSVFSLRLLRAYTAVKDQVVQRQLVILVEMIAASQR